MQKADNKNVHNEEYVVFSSSMCPVEKLKFWFLLYPTLPLVGSYIINPNKGVATVSLIGINLGNKLCMA